MCTQVSRPRHFAAMLVSGIAAALAAGCAQAPREPTCIADQGDTSPDALTCRSAYASYKAYMNRSAVEKLAAGDEDTWMTAAEVVGGSIAGVGLLTVLVTAIRREEAPSAKRPPPQPVPELPSLVGTRIRYAGTVCVIVDDSQPSVAVARACGGRAAVTAADGNGAQGVLFIGFDAAGNVREAATESSEWAPAVVVH